MSEKKKLTKAEKREQKQAKRQQKLERAAKRPLNRYFHHIDRGSTLGREIVAGILVCILSVCGIFMNLQLISSMLVTGSSAEASVADIAANGELICQMYMFSMLAAFVGTLIMGVVARLPLAQIPSMGLSTVLIASLGIGSGLTWQNLLALCFVSSLVYLAVVAVPAVNRAVMGAIPKSVRRAAPAAIGVLLVFICLQLTGIVQAGSTSTVIQGVNSAAINTKKFTSTLNGTVTGFSLFDFGSYISLGYKGDSFYPWIFTAMGGALTAAVAYLLTRRTKHPVMYSLLAGTVGFFIGYLTQVVFYMGKNGAINFELDSLWGRLWMVGSEDAQHLHLSYILNHLQLGEIFTNGFDFTAFTEAGGSVALLYATAILTFLFMNLSVTDAVAGADEKQTGLALTCNAGINVLAPIFGVAPMAVTPASVAGKRDGAKSGISAVVASIGFLISAFVWLIPFIFCTTTSYDIVFNLYGHYGTVIQMMTEQTSFLVADGVMAIVGLIMIGGAVKEGFADGAEAAPFLAVILCAFFTMNLAFGMAAGMVTHLLVSIFNKDRQLTVGNGLAAAASLALIVVTLL